MVLNEKLMKEATSEKGKFHFADDRLKFDADNKLFHHKWHVPSNTIGTTSASPSNQMQLNKDYDPHDALSVARPKISRPLSAMSLSKPNLRNLSRPSSASNLFITFGFNSFVNNKNVNPTSPLP
jgi:hypothetical protein